MDNKLTQEQCTAQAKDVGKEAMDITLQQEAAQQEDKAKDYSELMEYADKELKELGDKYEGAPCNMEQLWASSQCDRMLALWSKGLSVEEAYCAINAGDIIEREREQVRQATITQLYGKSHLAPVRGTADVTAVPDEVMRIYKKMMPKLTETQIREEYKKYMTDK